MAILQSSGINALIQEGKDSSVEENRQSVAVSIDGQSYGVITPSDQIFFQPISPIFRDVAGYIWSQSAILNLDEAASRQNIYEAYRKDLDLLQRVQADLETLVRLAIRFSIVRSRGNQLSSDEQWETIREALPPAGKKPLLVFSSELAGQPVETVVKTLKEEFDRGMSLILSQVSFWCHLLVDGQFVGIATWNGPESCVYHYFIRENDKRKTGSRKKVEENGLNVTTSLETTTRQREFRERHTHHLVGARSSNVDAFSGPMPERVKKFLHSVPQWLRPYLCVVTGEMTLEEVNSRVLSDETSVTTRVISVWQKDPAITFGRFVLTGWTEADAINDAGGSREYFRKALRTCGKILGLAAKLSIFAIIIAGLLSIKSCVHEQSVGKYNDYVHLLAGQKQYVAKVGESMAVPGNQNFRYEGTDRSAPWVSFDGRYGRNKIDLSSSWTPDWADYYGDTELDTSKIHTIRANDKEIVYTVESK